MQYRTIFCITCRKMAGIWSDIGNGEGISKTMYNQVAGRGEGFILCGDPPTTYKARFVQRDSDEVVEHISGPLGKAGGG